VLELEPRTHELPSRIRQRTGRAQTRGVIFHDRLVARVTDAMECWNIHDPNLAFSTNEWWGDVPLERLLLSCDGCIASNVPNHASTRFWSWWESESCSAFRYAAPLARLDLTEPRSVKERVWQKAVLVALSREGVI
jgi:hypothetical protein